MLFPTCLIKVSPLIFLDMELGYFAAILHRTSSSEIGCIHLGELGGACVLMIGTEMLVDYLVIFHGKIQ